MSIELQRDYQIGEEIGSGRFGIVRRCTSKQSLLPFAVKSVDKSLLLDSLDRDCAAREAKLHLLASAGNPHAAQIHAAYEDHTHIHLVLDLLPGGDLLDRLSHNNLTELQTLEIISTIAEAVAICHRRGIAHRDIKPENILFDSQGFPKLCDFGSAEVIGTGMRGVVGTPYYVAPEVVMGREYGEKVDVWSLGVVMYVMLSGGLPPFGGDNAAEILDAVTRANLRFPTRYFHSVSASAKDLMRRMMCKDVSRRYSIEQVLRHPWITSGGESGVAETT